MFVNAASRLYGLKFPIFHTCLLLTYYLNRVLKVNTRNMRLVGHLKRRRATKNSHKILVGGPEGIRVHVVLPRELWFHKRQNFLDYLNCNSFSVRILLD